MLRIVSEGNLRILNHSIARSLAFPSAMTDIDMIAELVEITIAAASRQCLESFATCLAQASAIHPREFSRVEDQVARFSTWTSGIGVFAPGRASMDHRLRYAPEVQSVAIGLLNSLNHRIRKCKLQYLGLCFFYSNCLNRFPNYGWSWQKSRIGCLDTN